MECVAAKDLEESMDRAAQATTDADGKCLSAWQKSWDTRPQPKRPHLRGGHSRGSVLEGSSRGGGGCCVLAMVDTGESSVGKPIIEEWLCSVEAAFALKHKIIINMSNIQYQVLPVGSNESGRALIIKNYYFIKCARYYGTRYNTNRCTHCPKIWVSVPHIFYSCK